uniref:Leucine-rich repeat-containing protein 49-like n=1 Tax=Castor canadensis TaxID=51338 RepID=A0A8B7V9P0_CASCN|nr:leucine-rich repeat-containing protein 49-like [Castor canadensis]
MQTPSKSRIRQGCHSAGPDVSGDHINLVSSSMPSFPILQRSSEEKILYSDRLTLERQKLTVCPIINGEEHLRLLNFQHNFITRIQNISNLQRLIFLDLYDNQIEEISGLSTLKSLRVLLLGKNRIKKISNLENLKLLDVLDLHGNQITKIENVNHLCDLRVLNLARNLLSHVDNLNGLDSLTELNLRHNQITLVKALSQGPDLRAGGQERDTNFARTEWRRTVKRNGPEVAVVIATEGFGRFPAFSAGFSRLVLVRSGK